MANKKKKAEVEEQSPSAHLGQIAERTDRIDNVKITKIKLKNELFLYVEFKEDLPGHSKNDTKLDCTVPVHEDLKTELQKLHVHLAMVCDEVKTPRSADFESLEFDGFYVRGFSIGGTDESEGMSISGYKEGKYGTVNLNSPFKKWMSSDYPYISQLAEQKEAVIHEVIQYLFHGKKAPDVQIEMDFT